MRKRTITSSASALLLLTASVVATKHGIHDHLEALHKRHHANRRLNTRSMAETEERGVEIGMVPESTSSSILEKRGGQCVFPTDAGLVAVTPGELNAGWAMSPDQQCTPGSYCPYACPPGQVSMQWDPSATSYSYPKSMNGGLYCDDDGNIQKPFPDKAYCESTATNIGVVNNADGHVSFCQTVLPGNEAMLIPTLVDSYATLAMPDTNYWCGTAAHYYINPPGIGTEEACVWGTKSNPVGNWSPYVAGGNVDASGETFIKLGWNPIYLEPATPFRNEMPTWGVKIDCPDGGCNGLPCAIDPTQNSVNEMIGSASDGAGGGAFCVVTVAKGSTANFVVFSAGGESSSGSSGESSTGSGSGSSTGSSSPSSSTGSGRGGQFFQSTNSAQAAPTSSAESSSSPSETTWSEPPSSSSSEPTSSAWASSSWESSSWSSAAPSSSSEASYTTSYPSRFPTSSVYYSWSNNATTLAPVTATSELNPVEATATPSGPSIQPSIQPATGAAPVSRYSLTSILSVLGLYILVTL